MTGVDEAEEDCVTGVVVTGARVAGAGGATGADSTGSCATVAGVAGVCVRGVGVTGGTILSDRRLPEVGAGGGIIITKPVSYTHLTLPTKRIV